MAVQRYLNGGAPSVTVVRVLGIGGYTVDYVNVVLTGSGAAAAARPKAGKVLATLLPSRKVNGTGDLSGTRFVTDVSAEYKGSNVAHIISCKCSESCTIRFRRYCRTCICRI